VKVDPAGHANGLALEVCAGIVDAGLRERVQPRREHDHREVALVAVIRV